MKRLLLLALLGVAIVQGQTPPSTTVQTTTPGVITDNGTTLSVNNRNMANGTTVVNPTTGITTPAVSIISDGVHAGIDSVVGNTTVPAIPLNSFGWIGPNSASFTSYFLQPTAAAPALNSVFLCGSPTGNISSCSWTNAPTLLGTNFTGVPRSAVSLSGPQVTVLTSGSAATYTTPTGALYLIVEGCGGGGGGGGSGTTPGSGTNGAATTFGSLTGNPGSAGSSGNGGSGGSATGGDVNISGQAGYPSIGGYTFFPGPAGGNSYFGGAGGSSQGGGNNGLPAAVNSCSGGGGGSDAGTAAIGTSGGAGGYFRKLIASPTSTYTYTIGAGGSGGAAGTSGNAGGAGAAGIIIVTGYFQ